MGVSLSRLLSFRFVVSQESDIIFLNENENENYKRFRNTMPQNREDSLTDRIFTVTKHTSMAKNCVQSHLLWCYILK